MIRRLHQPRKLWLLPVVDEVRGMGKKSIRAIPGPTPYGFSELRAIYG